MTGNSFYQGGFLPVQEESAPNSGSFPEIFPSGQFADGGFMSAPEQEVTQEDGTVEPIPPGSLPEEVADDIDAKLSVGELVIPADVVRWFGVKTFEEMRAEAKEGFAHMEQSGRIQSPGGLMEPPAPETPEEDLAEPMEEPENPFAEPGDEPGFATGGMIGQPATAAQGFTSAPYQDQFGRGIFTPPPTTAMPTPSPAPGTAPTPAPAPGTPAPVDAAAATPAPQPTPADTGSTWVAPAAVAAVAGAIGGAAASGGSTAQASPTPSGSSDSGGGLIDAAGSMAEKWAGKQLAGGLGSLVTSGGDAAGTASTGSLGGDLAGLGDAIGSGASDAWTGVGNWAAGKWDSASSLFDSLASGDFSSLASNINWSSIGSSAATTAGSMAAAMAGQYLGGLVHGPSDQEDVKTTVPVATAVGATIGSIVPGVGTIIGAGIGAFVGMMASGEPDIPYSFSGGSVVQTDKGNAIAFTEGYAQNKGNPDTGTRMGNLVGNYVNLRAANEGLIVNPQATGIGTGAIGYRAGQGYFYAAPGHAPGEDDYAWHGSNMKELADVAYNDMIDRGILISAGQTVNNPGRTAQERSDLANAEHERSLFVEANGN